MHSNRLMTVTMHFNRLKRVTMHSNRLKTVGVLGNRIMSPVFSLGTQRRWVNVSVKWSKKICRLFERAAVPSSSGSSSPSSPVVMKEPHVHCSSSKRCVGLLEPDGTGIVSVLAHSRQTATPQRTDLQHRCYDRSTVSILLLFRRSLSAQPNCVWFIRAFCNETLQNVSHFMWVILGPQSSGSQIFSSATPFRIAN